MIKVYAITLALGVLGLIAVLFGTAVSTNADGKGSRFDERVGTSTKTVVGAMLGFAMAGMAAEYSPVGFSWQIALLIAVGGLIFGGLWTRYALGRADD